MTAQTAHPFADPLADVADPVGAAHAHVAAAALRHGTERRVGLELELHLVDLADPGRRPDWATVRTVVAGLPAMPAGSAVTLEPGGQVELSTPPADDVVAAVAALRADREVLRTALAAAGFGAAPLGTDPAREVRRTNPHARYAAMEEHFTAVGCATPARQMMSATAALQVNLDAGPAAGWPARFALLRSLAPVLVAASSGSPYLAGHASGWHSMRQQAWSGIDPGRAGPVAASGAGEQVEPGPAWADYALAAPVMLLDEGDRLAAVTERITFAEWLAEPDRIGRPATSADLDYHLTTLFPPVRPRGYLEIRCVDALPDRWWPALAALTVTLVDDPVAADRAAEITEPVTGHLLTAARSGLADPAVRRAVTGCVEVAVQHCPPPLRADLEPFAELVSRGRTPCDELRAGATARGPLRLLEEEAHA